MTDLNKSIEYIFTIRDNISASASQIADGLDSANESIHLHEQAQEQMVGRTEATLVRIDSATTESAQAQQVLREEMDRTSARAQAQQMDLLTQLTSVMALREGVSAVTGGLVGMGLVGEDTAKTLMKINAGFSLFAGVVQTLKAVQGVMVTLNTANAIGASIDAFRATLQNPAMLAGIGIAAGSALGVAGAFMLTRNDNSTVNNQTTITVQDTTPQTATSEIYQVVAGGAL